MDDEERKFTDRVDELKRARDELRLKAHLLRAEARDEWEKAEAKWRQVQAEQPGLAEAAGEALDEIGDSVKRLLREIGQAYARIRASK